MLKATVALITDFGADSYHTGVMKGVIHKINPTCDVIDVTHDISPFNVIEAMYVLDAVFRYFPAPTIFTVVVDPGVGSERRPVIGIGENCYYICPDNGVFSRVLRSDSFSKVIHIKEEHYMLKNKSHTFHGRDVFAPCAAWLSKVLSADNFGNPIDDYMVIDSPKIRIIQERTLEADILFTDHFGNLVTNFEADFLSKARSKFPGNTIQIKAGEQIISGISNCYSDVPSAGDYVAYFGSMNLLEIGSRERNAKERLGLKTGDSITIYFGD
jgi:S-adenosyl-L-methionine hydrolase (adenosine-forming)